MTYLSRRNQFSLVGKAALMFAWMLGCAASEDTGHCEAVNLDGQRQCAEYTTGDTGTLKTIAQACGGYTQGPKWGAGACSKAGVVAGCRARATSGNGSAITITVWYYAGSVDSVAAECDDNQVLVTPDGAKPGGVSGTGGNGAARGNDCNTLVDIGALVTGTEMEGSPPTAQGGLISDGTYVLTRIEVYPPARPEDPYSSTLRISGTSAELSSTAPAVGSYGSTHTTSTTGASWTWMQSCPTLSTGVVAYTATATTLKITTGSFVSIFTRRP